MYKNALFLKRKTQITKTCTKTCTKMRPCPVGLRSNALIAGFGEVDEVGTINLVKATKEVGDSTLSEALSHWYPPRRWVHP